MIRELIFKNRSYRRFFQEELIDYKDLIRWVDLARNSPSGRNLQPLKYKLIVDQDEAKEIFSHLQWAGYLKDWDGPMEGERPSAYIAMFLDKEISSVPHADHGIAMQAILLGATEDGYGGCIIASVDRKKLMDRWSLSENLELLCIIALGKPKENVVLVDAQDGEIHYYRDSKGNHHVPKRSLEDIIL